MKYYYLGAFPPPYGGVTIKNKILYTKLKENIAIDKVDLSLVKKKNIKETFKLCRGLINPNSAYVIGAAGDARKYLSALLYFINRKSLRRSILIVMGGDWSRIIAKDSKYLKWVREYKQIYVETNGMKNELIDVGINNVSVFPNCREKSKEMIKIKHQDIKKIRCLFFSLISKEKGADIVIEASKLLNEKGIDYSIDFYGHIEAQYQTEFKKQVDRLENVNYCGVFSADQENVYSKLNKYDVLLFPTRWKAEGVPGVLVEAKIAGVPAIVSNINFNSEIVEDEKTGFVLNKNTPDVLANAIESVYSDRDYLMEMKHDAMISAESYLYENYIDDIVEMIRR